MKFPTVQQLLEQSFKESDIKLTNAPSCFIIQMPRFGKSFKLYKEILPSHVLDITNLVENCENVPQMELFAVLSFDKKRSHYVAFVKCGLDTDVPWCFFDSMSEWNDYYYIPEVESIPSLTPFLSKEGSVEFKRRAPEHAKLLFCDAYICMYQNKAVELR